MNPAKPPNITRHHPTWADVALPNLTSVRQNLTGSDQI